MTTVDTVQQEKGVCLVSILLSASSLAALASRSSLICVPSPRWNHNRLSIIQETYLSELIPHPLGGQMHSYCGVGLLDGYHN